MVLSFPSTTGYNDVKVTDQFDTSFIPQQPLLKVEGTERFKEQVNLPLIIGFVFLFISVSVFGGFFFYEMNVERRIVALEKDLEAREATLNIPEIDRLKVIDTRVNLARELLEGHVAFSTVLALLEKITAENIGFTSLGYAPDEKGGIKVGLIGLAPSYAAVYVQAEAWRGMRELLKKVDMSLPALNPESGEVTFNATLVVDPAYIRYARTVRERSASAPAAEVDDNALSAPDDAQP